MGFVRFDTSLQRKLINSDYISQSFHVLKNLKDSHYLS